MPSLRSVLLCIGVLRRRAVVGRVTLTFHRPANPTGGGGYAALLGGHVDGASG